MTWEGKRSIVTHYQSQIDDGAPSNPKSGDVWYNTDNKSSYIWDGSTWKIVRGVALP